MEHGARILIDSNAIIEAHRLSCWANLQNFFKIESVEACMTECSSGNQRRRDYVPVDTQNLRNSIAVHQVGEALQTKLILDVPSAADIDLGERDLLAYAQTQNRDVFLLCSPDKAGMRVASKLGLLDQLVSLEALAARVGLRKLDFAKNYTESWHKTERTKILMDM